jgi:ABC-type Fe3+/spermidine/putrescine transport system ATPase subunit
MSAPSVLSVRDLAVGYGPRNGGFELRVGHLDLRAGEVLAVLGPNGAGKSTLLLAMAGLLRPHEGRVSVETERPQALVFQRPVMLRGSVAYNAELPLWARGIPRTARRERAASALARFGIGDLGGRRAATVSAGELRRLALARAFVTEPGVLLLDEPFDDLDIAGREALSLDLRRAIAETEVAVAMVTHDLRQALLLAERIAVLAAGRLVQVGARDHVLRSPDTPAAARLVGMENLIPGVAVGRDASGLTLVELSSGHRIRAAAPAPSAQRLYVGIRPEHVKLDAMLGERARREAPSPANGPSGPLHGTVQRVVSDGILATAWIDWDGIELRTHLIAGRGLGHALEPGDKVWFAINPEDVHLMPQPAE